MRFVLKCFALAVALLVLLVLAWGADLVLNNGRVFYALLGRDRLIEACRPTLVDELRSAGFQPSDVAFGDSPDISISTLTGKNLRDTFTFLDGAAETRIDGIVACVVSGPSVTVDFRTRSTPVRAT